MYYSSQWGSICSTGWDIVDTAVACSQLGFTDMNSINFTVSAKSSAGSQPIHSSNVQCNGEEPTIFACSQDPFGNNSCSHSSVVMVMCGTSSALGKGNFRLINCCNCLLVYTLSKPSKLCWWFYRPSVWI